MRSCRHAHTDGLTKWIVRMPRRLSVCSRPRLKSGASTPMNIRAPTSRNRRPSMRRNRNSSGTRPSTSVTPRIASVSSGTQASQPASSILGPAMPTKRTPGIRARTARIRSAASASPDASPATIPIVTSPATGCRASPEASRMLSLPHDSAARLFEERYKGREHGLLRDRFCKLCLGVSE